MQKILHSYSDAKSELLTCKPPLENYLKCCLHAHSKENNPYRAKDLIQVARKQGYDVLAITEHDEINFTDELIDTAEKANILLMPGIEASVGPKGDHILIVNTTTYPGSGKIKNIGDLRVWLDGYTDRKNLLVVAPHPFYLRKICVGDKLEENIDIFDAIEYSFFRPMFFTETPNNRALEIARKHDKPILGTGDIHRLWQLGTTYSMIKSEKDPESLVRTVKESKFDNCCIENHFENSCGLENTIIIETCYLGSKELLKMAKFLFLSKPRKAA